MKLRCPIQKNYLFNGKTCILNQLFGENPDSGFNGPAGHTGLDIYTLGDLKYIRDNKGWLKTERNDYEKEGRIPLMASHAGKTTLQLNPDKQKEGWGLFVTADPIYEAGIEVQYRTIYWHIETPFESIGAFWGAIKRTLSPTVVSGQIIAVAGNNGYTGGPHLHFELQKRINRGDWFSIDPMPYFTDIEVLFQKPGMSVHRWFYQGREITRERVEEIKKTLLPVI